MFPHGDSVVRINPRLLWRQFPVGLEGSIPFPSTSWAKQPHGWGRTSKGAKLLWFRDPGIVLHP